MTSEISVIPRVALVTGGTKRVGRAIVLKLAESGFDVAFTYRSTPDAARATEQAVAGLGRACVAIRADLSQPELAANAIYEGVCQRFNRLDLLVNNASVYKPAPLAETEMTLMREVAAVHVQSPLLLCKAFAGMLRASRGHIVNMCDFLGERPWPKYLIYSASKAALANLTLGLARELAPDVTVNGIAPGVVAWPDDLPQAERDKYLARVPLGRAGTPDDVAELVLFLATKGTYITGQIIRLDGGRSIA